MAEKSLSELEVSKMILIYEMMLQALVDKGNELVRFMVPCNDPRQRTKNILISIDNNLQLSEEDKTYYRELVETVDHLWLYRKARHTFVDNDSLVFNVNPTSSIPTHCPVGTNTKTGWPSVYAYQWCGDFAVLGRD